jgi:Tfp pilus assembly protein PilF
MIARLLARAVGLLWISVAPSAAVAQKLGTVDFPNSGSPAAQPAFTRGLLLLHSFEYPTAAIAFREAQKADPGFAMAYAGEALTYTHPVWNEQDTTAARAVLARLAPTAAGRRAKARTPREQLWMDAVETLYGAGSKPRRDTLFAAAMERIVAAHPADDEAKVFHALALLGLNQSVREERAYMRAGAIASDILRRKPDHPGAAHMVIHAFDDPMHAPLGLWAARAYSKIAPEAPHAQHMTSHIFVAMGMWDEVVSQNVIASGPDHSHWQAGHYTMWLGYGYLQQGRYDAARAHLAHLRPATGESYGLGVRPSLVAMRAAYLITSERWTDSVTGWSFAPFVSPMTQAIDAFVTGYAALKAGDLAGAEKVLASLAANGTPAPRPAVENDPRVTRILTMELRAAMAAARGQSDSAVGLALSAARLEDSLPIEFGPPRIPKPTHELAGEILLDAGRASDAQREFTKALEIAPGRSRALIGLARAASRAGDRSVAVAAARQLLRNWHSADTGLPERAEMERIAKESAPPADDAIDARSWR